MADETPKLWGTADTYKRYMAPPVRLTLAAAPPAIYWRAIWSKALYPIDANFRQTKVSLG